MSKLFLKEQVYPRCIYIYTCTYIYDIYIDIYIVHKDLRVSNLMNRGFSK